MRRPHLLVLIPFLLRPLHGQEAFPQTDTLRLCERRSELLTVKDKLHVWIGTLDTFRLEGAVRLLRDDLAKVGSDADILLVEGRDHGSLFRPHPELWPDGMLARIHKEMRAQYDAAPGSVK